MGRRGRGHRKRQPKPNPPTLNAFESSSSESISSGTEDDGQGAQSLPVPPTNAEQDQPMTQQALDPELLAAYFPDPSLINDFSVNYLTHLMGVWKSYGLDIGPGRCHEIRTHCMATTQVVVTEHANVPGQFQAQVQTSGEGEQEQPETISQPDETSEAAAADTDTSTVPPVAELPPGVNLVFTMNAKDTAELYMAYPQPYRVGSEYQSKPLYVIPEEEEPEEVEAQPEEDA